MSQQSEASLPPPARKGGGRKRHEVARPFPEESPATAATLAHDQADPKACPVRNPWVRRIGAAGFLFFLIKGLLWLLIPAGVAAWRWWQ